MLLARLDELAEAVDRATTALATARKVPDEVWDVVEEIREARNRSSSVDLSDADPYLLLALDSGLLRTWSAQTEAEGEDARRRALRPALEQVREAIRDLRAEAPVADTRSIKEVAGWLDEVLDASQSDVAALLDISPRQYQRWVSPASSTEPRGEDARRLRVLAQIVQHLRHVLTGPGVLAWFDSPHPGLDGEPPAVILADPKRTVELLRLASAARSARAA